jgi:DNA invertase Pin-like site-specific DNA recombinase
VPPDKPSIRRCAIYTRKSCEEGLEQDFNSLQAQREACEAFIQSQAGEGWRLIKAHYDDGGLSGGSMERPALRRLLADIEQGLIEVVVVYKVDRLTRALADFAKMVEVFDAHGVSFVAVTQQFNTTSSMGRLTLNVLLSFAQFEREVTGERIRDKIAASKRKGMWMGGIPPLGYNVCERRLVVNPGEAQTVRHIYQRYLELGSVRRLQEELDRAGTVSKVRESRARVKSGGRGFSRGALYELLANPIFRGEVRHKGERHKGQHQAIIECELWEQVQEALRTKALRRGRPNGDTTVRLLSGKLFDEAGDALALSSTSKGGRHYSYYVSRTLLRGAPQREGAGSGWRLAANEIERAVVLAVGQILKDQPAIVSSLHEAGISVPGITAACSAAAVLIERIELDLNQASAALAPLVERVVLRATGLDISLCLDPLLPESGLHCSSGSLKINRLVPLQLKRRGVELRLVFESEENARPIDAALLKAVARGYSWFQALAAGASADTLAIARREGLPDSYVRRLLPLAFLAPSLVEAICAGTQPVTLTAASLKRAGDLPYAWRGQESFFAAPSAGHVNIRSC